VSVSEGANGRPRLVSVVVPVRGEEPHLEEQLRALAGQTYMGEWEMVIVDNGAGERTLRTAHEWADRLPSLRVVDASSKRGLNHARNAGAAAARGEFLAYCDADDVAGREWLEGLVEAAPSADLVGGALELDAVNSGLVRRWFDWDAPASLLNGGHGFLPYLPGGNCGVWAEVARRVRWDEGFVYGSSDKEFAWRAQLASYRAAFAPRAVMHQRFSGKLAAVARQYFRYGMSHAHLYRRFRGAGMPRSDLRDAAQDWRWLVRRAPEASRSAELRGRWLRVAALRLGRLVGSLRARVLFP
jgi:glycosyltransferase involved in cell wall biosynthesis